MKFFTFFKRFLRLAGFFSALALVAGVVGIAAYMVVLPRLAASTWAGKFPWLGTLTTGPTIIEKTEQIILPPEEGLERSVSAPRTAVVSIVSIPTERTVRTWTNVTVHEWSGVLVTNDGLVATYANDAPLIEGRRFTVFFADGNASQAHFVAYDAVINVAYFRTERTDTPAIAFANSTDVRPGRRFLALAGTIDPVEGRLSVGYIGEHARTFNLSGKTVASTDAWEGVFLPDRLIGSGFSGGAAVAMNGELIGLIGTLTLDTSEQSFILPANVLRKSLQRVIGGDILEQKNFGAYYVTLTKETALLLGVSRDRGALIFTPSEKTGLALIAGSPAERAGLRYGDIVTALNSREINLDWPLSVALYETSSETAVTLTVLRGPSELSLRVAR